jgi:nucleoside-diphosphate-sugar epimerase
MQVLITGGTGFIGSQLARRLVQQGDEVRVLSLINTPAESSNAEDLAARGVDLVMGNVSDRGLYDRALDGVQVVHHIAATMREADVPDSVFWDTNVAATQDLVQACRERGVRRFVYCSTMGVTGDVRGRRVDETLPYRPKDIYTRRVAAAGGTSQRISGDSGAAGRRVRPQRRPPAQAVRHDSEGNLLLSR